MKIAMFTDIHFGAKSNSEQHLKDCSEFIDWFCQQVKRNKVDAVCFLGDWFESRESIMLHTLNASHENAKKLNDLGVPIYFITGNHDLRYKSSREVSSTVIFSEFSNFVVIQDTMLELDLGGPAVLCPFFFHDEYGAHANILNNKKYVFGHFEFKGFVVTGKTVTLEHGPDHAIFNKPKYIFSGHFHKRQKTDNVVFIGNPFPTNYGDVQDSERGMCILDTSTDKLTFLNFPSAPSYFYSSLLDLVEQDIKFPEKSNVKCFVDVNLSYSEIQDLRSAYMQEFNLREFIVEDNFSASEMARQDGAEVSVEVSKMPTKDAVVCIINEKLELVNSGINKERLVELFNSIT